MESGNKVSVLRIRSVTFSMRNSHLNKKIPTRIPAANWCYWQMVICRLFLLNCTLHSSHAKLAGLQLRPHEFIVILNLNPIVYMVILDARNMLQQYAHQ